MACRRAGWAAALLTTVGSVALSATPSHATPHAGPDAPYTVRPAAIATPGAIRTFFDATPDAAPPDDPGLPRQLRYLDAVGAPSAWATQRGSKQIRIAILDSGVDVNHPDLRGKIVGTYDAHTGGTDVHDAIGHGTFVAGIAAAETDNGVGVAGAGYDASILAVKIADDSDGISIDDEVAGIEWAVAHGANVINLSLGGPLPSPAEASAIADAQKHGVLVVAAAGNTGTDGKEYPAAYPGVLAVGATDGNGGRADFSSYGSWVNVAAPGTSIFSTAPTDGSEYFAGTSGYATADGTSFASPLVAGEAALLKSADPDMTLAQLRSAIVASAHGYHHLGLGAGQVDFPRALRHVPPRTAPTTALASGTAGTLTFTASSSAAEVAFAVDGGRLGAPVSTTNGTATVQWSSLGYANGLHTLHAVACTRYGECGVAARSIPFLVRNAAPRLTSPSAHATLTGLFTVRTTRPDGAPVQLLVDGRPTAVEPRRDEFTVSGSALRDGVHTLTVRTCTSDGKLCAGPVSTPVSVTTRSLHPRVQSIAPAAISPNHDGVQDSATLVFDLDERATTQLQIVDAGGTVRRTIALGTLGAGRHTWHWSGRWPSGTPFADGHYSLAVATSHGALRGWVATGTTVDITPPALAGVTASRAGFYPYPDGYRDSVTVRGTVAGARTVTLTVRTTHGTLVRKSSRTRPAASASLSWDGTGRTGRRVAAGNYRMRLTAKDAAGNTTSSPVLTVHVSDKRLVRRVVYVTRDGAHYADSGATARCATARSGHSTFSAGVVLRNACADDSAETAFVHYLFTLPAALRYSHLTIQVYGRATQRCDVATAIGTDEGSLEVPGHVAVSAGSSAWHTIVDVPARTHVAAHRRVYVGIVLNAAYAGTNVFDLRSARLRVTESVLAAG